MCGPWCVEKSFGSVNGGGTTPLVWGPVFYLPWADLSESKNQISIDAPFHCYPISRLFNLFWGSKMKNVLDTIEKAIKDTVEEKEGQMIEIEVSGETVYVIIGLQQNFEMDPENEFDDQTTYH